MHRVPGRRQCLYLSTADPGSGATGTATRCGLLLQALAARYVTHAVYLRDARSAARCLPAGLAGDHPVPCSTPGRHLFSPGLLAAARRVLAAGPFDFVFADAEQAGLYARLAARGLPLCYSAHNVEHRRHLDLARARPLRYPLAPYAYLAERLACRHARLVVAICEPDAGLLGRWAAPGRILVLPCAFDERVFHPLPAVRAGRPTALMVANFCYGPNRQAARELCRRVLPQVRGRLPAAVLRFVGAGFPDELRGSGVEAPGYVPELLPEYARAGVVLAPLTTGGGIKIKVVEALAAGRPLVATAQAMHGIEYRDLAGVTVVDLEGFAAATVAALEASPPDLGGNWERVQERFGARRQAARLIDRIDAELGDPPPAVPATREDRGI